MNSQEELPGMPIKDWYKAESDVLYEEASNPDLPEEQRTKLGQAADLAMMRSGAEVVKENLKVGRPGIEFPDAEEGETPQDYMQRLIGIAESYDESKQGE